MSLGAVLEIDEHSPPRSSREKSIEYIVTEKGCWECISHSLTIHGYPQIQREGRKGKVHRYVYELTTKPIDEGMNLCHECDNPLCINPSHMFEGTQTDNMRDMDNKGRRVVCIGEENGLSKLTNEKVLYMRDLFESGGYSLAELGRMFEVSHQSVSAIVYRRTWRHL